MITIVDYGMGNLCSVQKALEHEGARVEITCDPEAIERAEKLVLPGVGAFGDAMANLRAHALVEPIQAFLRKDRPFFGICLGLQLLFHRGLEDGAHEGLGRFAGEVRRIEVPRPLKVPHMGWNRLEMKKPCPLLAGTENGANVYFVHSYHAVPEDASIIATVTDYGIPLVSAVWEKPIFATQFHPEKSQRVGLAMLRRFVEM